MLDEKYDIEQTRLQGWNCYIQQAVWDVAPETTWFLTGLANLDCGLIHKERVVVPKFKEPATAGLTSQEITDLHTFSALWVLGTYEVVRSFHQGLRENDSASVQASELCHRMRELKRKVERVRIPLAKFEKPDRFPGDTGTAIPGVQLEKGAGWWVTPTEFVTRRELSDALLEMLQDWKYLIQKPHAD